jgi:hypothetical protein
MVIAKELGGASKYQRFPGRATRYQYPVWGGGEVDAKDAAHRSAVEMSLPSGMGRNGHPPRG